MIIKCILMGIVIIIIAMLVCGMLYWNFGFFKKFYHDVLGWHQPDDSLKRQIGINTHSYCKHCGADIIQDSQGNWF